MTWEPCLDEPCWPPLTSGGGMTVPELRPVKIWSDKITIRECVKLPVTAPYVCGSGGLTCWEPLLLVIVPRIRGGGAEELDRLDGWGGSKCRR